MESDFVPLTREQCLRQMGTAPVGRVIYTRHAMPAVELVNFAMDAGDIVIRTEASGKLTAAIDGAVVAFETDEFDPASRTGWSVTAVGHAREVTDPADIDRLRAIGPHPWVPGDRPYFVRITPGTLNGRWLRPRVSATGSGPEEPEGHVPPPAQRTRSFRQVGKPATLSSPHLVKVGAKVLYAWDCPHCLPVPARMHR